MVDLRFMFGEGETRVTKKTKILIVDTGDNWQVLSSMISILSENTRKMKLKRLRQLLLNMKPDT